MVSHTTWTSQALLQLITNNDEIKLKSDRPGDLADSQRKQVLENVNSHQISTSDIQYIKSIASMEVEHDKIDYQKLSSIINNIFRTKSRLYISKNLLTYTRLMKNIIVNHIIGHSSGAEFRDQNVNPGVATYYHERQAKLQPTFFNGRTVFYFDFGCSAGYDHDEIGHPDFVYSNPSGLFVSPRSTAILPSITNASMMVLAKEMGLKVTRRHIPVEELATLDEAAACGTACVLSPIDKVIDPDKGVTYTISNEPGPIVTKLYNALQDIQFGRVGPVRLCRPAAVYRSGPQSCYCVLRP